MGSDSWNDRTHEAWEAKAEFWDGLIGDVGNVFHRTLVAPSAERLLNPRPGEAILDVACGNGTFARRLAEIGAAVTATDFSEAMIERARARAYGDVIDYRVMDATDEEPLAALGEGFFDAAVCNMALMDIANIDPLMRAVRRLLKPGTGRFVFTVMHPCFNASNTVLMVEQEDRAGEIVETCSVKVSNYLHAPPAMGAGAPNEPAPHVYFHRPLHELLSVAFAAGLVMDGIEEPAFDGTGQSEKKQLSWLNYADIPPVLAVRMR